MPWQKLGKIFPPQDHEINYAAVPTVYRIESDRIGILYSDRDDENQSFPSAFAFTPPTTLASQPTTLFFKRGTAGYFDTNGIMPTWIQSFQDKLYLYYIGWNKATDVPFRNAIGLAISSDGGYTFQKYTDGPVLDRSIYDPCFVASCCTLIENNIWRMWYLSCINWKVTDGKLEHQYHIKYAESADGIHWQRHGHISIDFQRADEYAISRPCVVKDTDCYRMWYSYRGESYRIGYAESSDGLTWTRKDDEVGIDVSPSGWDAEMIEYPFVFDHKEQRYMLYNGNGYGKTGIGLAVWSPE